MYEVKVYIQEVTCMFYWLYLFYCCV